MPKPNRPQTCRGAVKEPMRNARTAAGFEPTPSKMPLCEASESLERQQASCPRHAKHKPAKMLPVTFGIHKTCVVAGTLAARLGPKPVYRNAECRGGGYAKLPKASNSSKSCPRHAKHKPEKRQAKNGAFATLPHGAETAGNGSEKAKRHYIKPSSGKPKTMRSQPFHTVPKLQLRSRKKKHR